MIYEGVNFNEVVIREMTKEDFEAMHVNVLWPDRDEATRRKMLGEVHGIITKPKRKAKE